jgi:hypothetical protein
MKKFIFTLVVVCLCGVEANAASRAFLLSQCKKMMREHPAEISISYNYGALELNHTKDSAYLAKLQQSIMKNTISEGVIEGLTTLFSYFEVSVSVSAAELYSGYNCFFPQKVNIKIGYTKPVLYIAKHLEKGTCNYQRTMRHEIVHLDFGQIAMNMFAQNLKEHVPSIVQSVDVYVSREKSAEQASQKMYNECVRRMTPMFEQFKADLAEQNALIDSKENYRQESLLCEQAK